MKHFVRTMLRLAVGCAVLGLVLSVAGVGMGGRLTNVRIHWNHGPRVEYTDVLDEGRLEFGVTDDEAPEIDAPDAPAAPDAPDAPDVIGAQAEAGLTPQGDIRELEVDISAASVKIIEGDAWDLQVRGNPHYTSECEGGVWKLETEDDWLPQNWNDVSFTITIPKGAQFDEVDLKIGAGTMTVEDVRCTEAELKVGAGTLKAECVTCEELKLEAGAGTMTLKELSCTGGSEIDVGMGTLKVESGRLTGSSEIHCGMGTVKLELERPSDYGYAVKSGMGTVKIDGRNYSGMAVKTEQNSSADTFYDVDCGMGTVKIEFR